MNAKVDSVIDAAWHQYIAAKEVASARSEVNRATLVLEKAEAALAKSKWALRILEDEQPSSLRDVLVDIAIAGGGQ